MIVWKSAKFSGNETKQKKNYLLNRANNEDKTKSRKTSKNNDLSKTKIEQDFTFLYVYGINNQDLKSLIKTLKLPIIITKEIQYADTILALANLVKNNRKLKQISHSKKMTIHTIQNNSLLQIAKALRIIAKKSVLPIVSEKAVNNSQAVDAIINEFITPLEETRLAIEEVVMVDNIAVDLFPRSSSIRKQQYELIEHYQLKGMTVGENESRRLRILPKNYCKS